MGFLDKIEKNFTKFEKKRDKLARKFSKVQVKARKLEKKVPRTANLLGLETTRKKKKNSRHLSPKNPHSAFLQKN